MMKIVYILIGSGCGGVTRYLLSKGVYALASDTFPLGTLVVNVSGSFLIGLLTGLFEHWIIPANVRIFIFVGFLGGFTTFSTYALESFHLLKATGIRWAFINVAVSNFLGIAMVFSGYFIAQCIIKLHK